ncbi:MAG: MBL fold metallo-hydrolase [Candidatus Odinarchaeota archaeon]
MFQVKPLDGYENIDLVRTCKTFFRRPLMWTCFLRIDNVFIDTGNTSSDGSKLISYLREKKAGNNWLILNTHLHEDHCGNNKLIQKETGANIYVPSKRENFDEVTRFYRFFWGRPELFECKELKLSTTVTDAGRKLKSVRTPGHTPCHVSYYLEEENLWITGDAIPLPEKKTYSMPEEDYKQTIRTLTELNKAITSGATVMDGHRGVLRDPRDYIEERIKNMEEVAIKVKKAWEKIPGDHSRVIKAVFGKSSLFYRLAAPRYSLDNTVRSIISD